MTGEEAYWAGLSPDEVQEDAMKEEQVKQQSREAARNGLYEKFGWSIDRAAFDFVFDAGLAAAADQWTRIETVDDLPKVMLPVEYWFAYRDEPSTMNQVLVRPDWDENRKRDIVHRYIACQPFQPAPYKP